MKKEQILNYLAKVKNEYQKEGFIIKALFGSHSREDKLHSHADDILSAFDDKDIKGMYDVRIYIAHCNNLVNKGSFSLLV